MLAGTVYCFFFSSRRRHTRCSRDWSSDVCSSDLDIFKHANYAGVARYGGVLALGGDDPLSKSSTIPSHSEVAFYDALFPVLFPGNTQEILDLGRLGFELSRYTGLWVGFKIVPHVAD